MSKKPEKPKTRKAPMSGAFAQALARHKAAQAAIDAADGPEGYPDHLHDEEFDAIDELAETPCASDAEFIREAAVSTLLRNPIFWGADRETRIPFGRSRGRLSLPLGERMTLRLRYRTLKLRALSWALRQVRARAIS